LVHHWHYFFYLRPLVHLFGCGSFAGSPCGVSLLSIPRRGQVAPINTYVTKTFIFARKLFDYDTYQITHNDDEIGLLVVSISHVLIKKNKNFMIASHQLGHLA